MFDIPFDVAPERVGLADISKYFDAKIEALRQMIETRPMPKSIYDGFHWQRKFMAHYGKILGGLEFAVDFGHMPVKMQQNMEQKVKRMIQYHTGVLMLGQK